MKNVDQFAEQYIALWNETEATQRRTILEALWTPDAADYLPTQPQAHRGLDEIEARVIRANEQWVQQAGFVFKLSGEPMVNHNGLVLCWDMISADGGVVSKGIDFLILDQTDKITTAYQYIGSF